MTCKLNILLVDKHPYIVYALKNILDTTDFIQYEINFHTASDCKQAHLKIIEYQFDMTILSLDLNMHADEDLYSGEDLGIMIRQYQPTCKIVILTENKQPYRLNQIFKTINPEGLLSKFDMDFEKSIFVYKNIIAGNSHISTTIIQSLHEFKMKNIQLDEYDKLILLRLSEGIKTIDLKNYIPLSKSAIEKRKQRLKIDLNVESRKDKDLITEATRLGIL